MNTPHIFQKKSIKLEMEPGDYKWCACGLSANQPFCDGSHKGSSFSPKNVIIEKSGLVSWCACKHSAQGHICDGTHKNL